MRTIRPTLRVVLTLLASCLGLATAPANAETIVRFSVGTTFFDVALSSDPALATTVDNFMNYVNTGRYTNTLIHRSTTDNPADIQIIQGGGFVLDGLSIDPIATDAPIPLQAKYSNTRGTIAMARTLDPNSATSGWFFNVTDNPSLNGNYAVFGIVTDLASLNVIDAIAAVPVYNVSSLLGPEYTEMPLLNYTPPNPVNTSNLVLITSIAPVPEPSTLVLAGVGLAAAAFTAARRSRRVAR
jgi:peptidyl-prolyl cis-trans isomerase A (cyclophilin A)